LSAFFISGYFHTKFQISSISHSGDIARRPLAPLTNPKIFKTAQPQVGLTKTITIKLPKQKQKTKITSLRFRTINDDALN